ncbi:MAG: hypothetical protein ABIH39_05225 [Candidatus Margulisiibacteriota bacterium]
MKRSLLIIYFLITCTAAGLASNWLDIGPDARGMGLGGARMTVTGDVYAAYWNPAALPGDTVLGSTYASLFDEVKYNYVGYAQPLSTGRFGFGYLHAGMAGFEYTDYISSRPVATGGEFGFGNSAFLMSYAEGMPGMLGRSGWFGGLYQPWMDSVEIGGTFKMLSQELAGETASGFGLDAGFIYRYSQNLRLGGVVYNLMPPSMAWTTGTSITFPLKARMGLQYQLFSNILLLCDMDVAGYDRGGVHVGSEYSFNKLLFLRAGYDRTAFSAGVGLAYWGVTFDFAYSKAPADYMEDSMRFSMGYVVPPYVPPPVIIVPVLILDMPDRAAEVSSSVINLSGKTRDTSYLLINGQRARLREDGGFAEEKELQMGSNNFELKAYSRTGEVVKAQREVIRKPLIITPELTLNLPVEPFELIKDKIRLSGQAKNTAYLLINGSRVPLDNEGNFSVDHELIMGGNSLIFKAYSKTGDSDIQTRIVTRKPEPVIPILLIDQPDQLIEIQAAKYGFSGKAEDTSYLLLNGKRVPLRRDGRFYVEESFNMGTNKLVVRAYSKTGNSEAVTLTVTRKPAPVIPRFTLSLPDKRITTTDEVIILIGKVLDTKTFIINGQEIFVRDDGRFYVKELLDMGSNKFEFKAISRTGDLVTETRVVNRVSAMPSKPSLIEKPKADQPEGIITREIAEKAKAEKAGIWGVLNRIMRYILGLFIRIREWLSGLW